VRRDGGAPFCLPQPCASTLSLACLSRRLGRNGAGRYCFQDTPCLARADNHRKSTAYLVAVAQLVERTTEDRKVTCSIQVSDTYFYFRGMSNVCSTIYFLTRVSHRRPSAIPPDDFHYHHDVSSKSDGLAGRVHGPTTRLRARSSAASRFGAGRVSPPLDLHPSPPLPPLRIGYLAHYQQG
jgi:hypothetical protein